MQSNRCPTLLMNSGTVECWVSPSTPQAWRARVPDTHPGTAPATVSTGACRTWTVEAVTVFFTVLGIILC